MSARFCSARNPGVDRVFGTHRVMSTHGTPHPKLAFPCKSGIYRPRTEFSAPTGLGPFKEDKGAGT